MKDEKKVQIDILLTEYEMIRQESIVAQKHQIILVSIYISAIGFFLANILNSFFNTPSDSVLVLILVYFIPIISLFIGTIWLDQVYRQFLYGVYIYGIEKKISEILDMELSLNWETWLHEKRASLLTDPRFLYYIIFTFVYIGIPVVSIIFGFECTMSKYMLSFNIGTFTYLVFIGAITVVFCIYIYKILTLYKKEFKNCNNNKKKWECGQKPGPKID